MQRSSTKLRNVEPDGGGQLSLIPDRKIISRPVNLQHLPLLRSTADAIDYACQLAGVVPKQIYPHMECQKSTWSRICSGEFDLDGRDIPKFNRAVDNSAYLLYLNHLDGWDLAYMRKAAQNDLERENAELRQELEDERRLSRRLAEGYRAARGA